MDNIEVEQNKKKINIFRKMIYSLIKPSKYREMAEEGRKSAIKYFILMVFIVAIFFTLSSLYSTYNFMNDGIEYLKNNVPELKYENETLTSETEESKILENEFLEYITGINELKVVIDTSQEGESKIPEYINSIGNEKNIAILLKDKIIMIDKGQEEQKEYAYSYIFKEYYENDVKSLTKQEFIESIINNVSYSYFFGAYFTNYLITIIITNLIYLFLLSLIGFVFAKATKMQIKYKEILKMTVYSFTFASIIYVIYSIINIFVYIPSAIFNGIYIISIYIYLLIALIYIKKNS